MEGAFNNQRWKLQVLNSHKRNHSKFVLIEWVWPWWWKVSPWPILSGDKPFLYLNQLIIWLSLFSLLVTYWLSTMEKDGSRPRSRGVHLLKGLILICC